MHNIAAERQFSDFDLELGAAVVEDPLLTRLGGMMFSRSAIALNFLLGLPPLTVWVCHGYANACPCDECVERDRLAGVDLTAPLQPWEVRPASWVEEPRAA